MGHTKLSLFRYPGSIYHSCWAETISLYTHDQCSFKYIVRVNLYLKNHLPRFAPFFSARTPPLSFLFTHLHHAYMCLSHAILCTVMHVIVKFLFSLSVYGCRVTMSAPWSHYDATGPSDLAITHWLAHGLC